MHTSTRLPSAIHLRDQRDPCGICPLTRLEQPEYAAINSMLDQINSCLDHLEEKNDYLHACLKELLESNRQTRLEFQQQSEQQNMEADVQGSQPPT
ncbi:hypothetical protein llap_16727 [Limosa lapponica baueri]|uniref:Uncharacterized protein n=1 Tax=Limosa lapponica baueri TaxID=1758121 RepID=A0A2I0TGN2_LIMLA|nr:hypothetical protein llap_16727 [Limosa lapponica baueri]